MKRIIGGTMGIFMVACSALTPTQVSNSLPSFTKSKFMTLASAQEAVDSGKCRCLAEGRSYAAPIQITANGDLQSGARGIDEWVQLDGGNAYVLSSYKWINVGDEGATQLHLEFDTFLCK